MSNRKQKRAAAEAAAAKGPEPNVAVASPRNGNGNGNGSAGHGPAARLSVQSGDEAGQPHKAERPFCSGTCLMTIFTILWIWLLIGSGLRYVFHAELRAIAVVFSIGFLAVGHVLLIGPPEGRSAFGEWMGRNKLRSAGWFVMSIPYLVLTTLDSDLLPEKLRGYIERVTLSEIWIAMFLLALFLFSLMALDALQNPDNVSPLPTSTKFAMFFTLILIFGTNYYDEYAEHSCALQRGHEYLNPQFTPEYAQHLGDVVSADVTAGAHLNVASASPSTARRSVHPKQHGCVRATFRVDKRLPTRLRVGTFQEGDEYPAWVRFSNGAHGIDSDHVPDVRGMAVKLMGVKGEKLLQTDPLFAKHQDSIEKETHDMLFVTTPVFPVNDALSYDQFLRAIGSPNPLLMLKYIFPEANPFRWRLRFLYTVTLLGKTGAITNPLAGQYFSATAYQYGHNGAVKYSLRPCVINANRKALDHKNKFGDSFLREALRRHLDPNAKLPGDWGLDETCFEFLVQEQQQPCREPVEDPTKEWTGPWIRVGMLTIPKQEFLARDQIAWCDALRYNPWNAPPLHRPLGTINLARKLTYWDGGVRRNELNHVQSFEPKGNEQFSQPQLQPLYQGAGDTKAFEYSRYDQPFQELPRKVKNFPEDLAFTGAKKARMASHILSVNRDFLMRDLLPFANFTTPDDYSFMLTNDLWRKASPLSLHLAKIWKTDAEFARGFVSGVNPMAIINPAGLDGKLPAAFAPSAEEAARIAAVAGGKTIDDLLSEKRLFYADYHTLHDIDMTQGRIFYAPIVLLYVAGNGGKAGKRLMPLAIQLTRSKTRHNRIFTPPKDSATANPYASQDGLVWLFAKMHAASADGQTHEMISHLLLTHLAMEPILVGFYRQFPRDHPIMQLMLPHFFDTLAINDLGRSTLLAAPATSDFERVSSVGIQGALQLMEKVYVKHWSLSKYRYPSELAARGFNAFDLSGNGDGLPDYLYRDYATLVWNAMNTFVTDVINKLYTADNAVANDSAIQGLIREMYDPEMGGLPFDDERPKEELKTRQQLIDFLTQIMFTCSAAHSVVNFGQFDYYAFVPNRPFHLTKPMPDDLSLVTLPYIMQALPQKERTQEIITLARTLTLMEPTGLLDDMLQSPGLFKYRESFPDASKKFIATLTAIEKTIQTRNKQIENVHFPYLEPKNIMPSISI